MIENELNAGDFLNRLKPALIEFNNSHKDEDGKEISEEMIIDKICSLAEKYYEDLFNSCPPEEQYVLFDMAHDMIDPKKINGTLVGNYTLKDPNGSASVYIGLTHLHNPSVLKLLESGWSLFSLDKVSQLGHGSAAEGFQMAYPWAYPYVFPKDYYAGKPDEPVLTVAIHDVLVSRNDLEPEKVYEVVSTLIENKSNLVRQNDIYTQLETDISKCRMSFPLQKGTINYLNRDKPSIWVRYANMLWPVLSVLAIFWGAIVSFQKRLKKQLKERIDKYYSELLHIRGKAFDDKYEGSKEELLEKLMHIRSRAFNSLKNNKLVADDSFIIFLRLYQEILDEIATKK